MAHPGPVAVLYLHDVKLQQKRLMNRVTQLEECDYAQCMARVDDVAQRLLSELDVDKIIDDRLGPLIQEHVSLKNENKIFKEWVVKFEDQVTNISNKIGIDVSEHCNLKEKMERQRELSSDLESAVDNLGKRIQELELSREVSKKALQDLQEKLDYEIHEHTTDIREHKTHLSQLDLQIRAFHKLLKEQKDTIMEKVKKAVKSKTHNSSAKPQNPRPSSSAQRQHNAPLITIPDSQPATLLNDLHLDPVPTPPASKAYSSYANGVDIPTTGGLETPLPTVERSCGEAPLTTQSTIHSTLLLQHGNGYNDSQPATVPTQLLSNTRMSQSSTNLLLATQPHYPIFSVGGNAAWETPSTQEALTLQLPRSNIMSLSSASLAELTSAFSSREKQTFDDQQSPTQEDNQALHTLSNSVGLNENSIQDNETQIVESQTEKALCPSSSRRKPSKTRQAPPAPERMQTRQMARSQRLIPTKRNSASPQAFPGGRDKKARY